MSKFRGGMSGLDRAKQFAPFAAIKGHEMELAKYHEVIEDRIQLAEDEMEEINNVLVSLNKGDMVNITHYWGNSYENTYGKIQKIYDFEKELQINDTRIKFADICRIEKRGL